MSYDDWKSTEPEVYFEPEWEPSEEDPETWPQDELHGEG